MGDAASKLGWLIFIVALVGAALHSGPDDPMTAVLKSSGLYQPYLVILWVVLGLAVIYLALVTRKTVAMRRQLDELKRKGR